MKSKRYLFCYILTLSLFFACEEKKESIESLYVAQDFTAKNEFTSGIEGPATDGKGNLYAVNFGEEGSIGIVDKAGKAEKYIDLPTGSVGNGIRINAEGNLLVADYMKHNVLEVQVSDKHVSVYAHEDSMHQPNDLAIMKNGTLFCSDPDWANEQGQLWRVDKEGKTHLVEKNMGTTNGVEVSPDEKSLYVNESVQRNVWAYDLSTEGEISNKRLLIQFPDFGMDGMRCDSKGNLFITRYGKGTVAMLSPEGKLIREIQLQGKKPSNIAFGGKDGKTAYVTLQDRGCIESFRVENPGREWAWRKK